MAGATVPTESMIQHCIRAVENGQPPKLVDFYPEKAAGETIPTHQSTYFILGTFQSAKEQIRKFAHSLSRPFNVYYNPYTECIEILDNKLTVSRMTDIIRSDVSVLASTLSNFNVF